MPIEEDPQIVRIRERLRLIEEQFERELRERGFDPSQADTVPLTPSLTHLQNEQEQLRSDLVRLTGDVQE